MAVSYSAVILARWWIFPSTPWRIKPINARGPYSAYHGGSRSLMQAKSSPCRLPSSLARPMEACMTARKTTDTNGSLGTESAALREELDQLAAAIERAAKSEGA